MILNQNFYVDELLWVFEISKDAIDTIIKVFGMTKAGGFRISVDYFW